MNYLVVFLFRVGFELICSLREWENIMFVLCHLVALFVVEYTSYCTLCIFHWFLWWINIMIDGLFPNSFYQHSVSVSEPRTLSVLLNIRKIFVVSNWQWTPSPISYILMINDRERRTAQYSSFGIIFVSFFCLSLVLLFTEQFLCWKLVDWKQSVPTELLPRIVHCGWCLRTLSNELVLETILLIQQLPPIILRIPPHFHLIASPLNSPSIAIPVIVSFDSDDVCPSLWCVPCVWCAVCSVMWCAPFDGHSHFRSLGFIILRADEWRHCPFCCVLCIDNTICTVTWFLVQFIRFGWEWMTILPLV